MYRVLCEVMGGGWEGIMYKICIYNRAMVKPQSSK